MSDMNVVQADVTLHLDDQGVIRQATLSNGIVDEGIDGLVGRPWLETVGESGDETVRGMLDDARAGGISAFHNVVQRFPSGLELPIEYTTVRLNGRRGGLIALGKNLQAVAELQSRLVAAQKATAEEYWKLREVETRYRLLFDASNEAVLTLAAADLTVVEANPAAIRGLGLGPGSVFPDELAAHERDALLAMLSRVRDQGRSPGIVLHMGFSRQAWGVRASTISAESGMQYLLHVSAVAGVPDAPRDAWVIDTLIERLPDGFVVVDAEGVVLRANGGFLDLVQAGTAGAVIGEKLSRWLSEPGADLAALLATLQRVRSLRSVVTVLHGDMGGATQVEVSGVGNVDADPRFFGFVLRDIERRAPADGDEAADDHVDVLLQYVNAQLGHSSLPEVIRQTSEIVERHMIKSALAQMDGNRTAASEMLGLSRQSLHTKLNRYGPDMDTAPIAKREADRT